MSTPEQPSPAEGPDAAEEPAHIGAGIDFSDPNSPLAPYYMSTTGVAAVAFLALVFVFFGINVPLAHTDVWGHLKYGEWIVENRALPGHEPFSEFSDPGQPLWHFQWLSQVIFYLTFRAGQLRAGGDELNSIAGGVEMLRTLHGFLIMLKVAFIMLAIRRSTRSMRVAIAGAVLLVILSLAPSRIERPQVFGEVCFAILIWWVSGRNLSSMTWLALPVLFVAWANTHGSFLIGLVFLGLFWLGRMIELIWSTAKHAPRPAVDSWLWQGTAALVLSPLAVGLINPHGLQLYSHVLQMAKNPNLTSLSEWTPLDFSQTYGGHWGYLATLVLLALSQAAGARPLSLPRTLILFAFALGPLYQQRMLIWWSLLVPWFAAEYWHHALIYLPRSWRGTHGAPSFRKTLMAGAILLIALSWSGGAQLLAKQEPLPLAASVTHATLWPLAMELKHSDGKSMPELAEALKDYPQHRFKGRIFVQETQADFLVWFQAEKAPVLVYSHAHLFPESIWQEHFSTLLGQPSWKSTLDRYRINLVIINPDMHQELAKQLRADPAWKIVKDEGEQGAGEKVATVSNEALLFALRKRPLLDGVEEAKR